MEPDPTNPLEPPVGEWIGDPKDPMKGVLEPGWWALIEGVWRWTTDPLIKIT
jgi:hypothetical protein